MLNGFYRSLPIFVPLQPRAKERPKMMKPPVPKPILTIDLKIRFQSRIYQISLSQVARWLVPLVVVVARLISHFRDNAS
jgi:hypothetical protein